LAAYSDYACEIEADIQVDAGRIELVRERFRTPYEVCGSTVGYHLQLAMLPTKQASLNCLSSHWRPDRYEAMGDLFILPPETTTRAVARCEDQRSVVCSLDPAKASEWFGSDFEWTDQVLVRSLNIANSEVRRLLFQIGEELQNPGFASQAMVEALLTQTCIELARYLRQFATDTAKGGLAPWRMRIVEDEVAREPGCCTVEALAQKCGLSVRQLSRAFRVSRGQTVADFIASERVRLARELLDLGTSVKETAFTVGFSSPGNFATAFQREVGCAPSVYRARSIASSSLAA
jgi:AraC family transcriptional regulator